MIEFRKAASFVRWQLVPVRYLGKVTAAHGPSTQPQHRLAITDAIEAEGYAPGPKMGADMVEDIRARYLGRARDVVPTAGGHPFVNLLGDDDLSVENPALRFAFSPEILDVADDYFHGRYILDSVQLLYSWPTDDLAASQYWHRDYGDSRSLHCVAYLNDVEDDQHGPFTFVDKKDARRIASGAIIRRIDDKRFQQELGSGTVRQALGPAGTSIWVDPAACYHYGSRCRTPRLALFVTFNSDRPFVAATPLILRNRSKLLQTALALRPDIGKAYLSRLLQI